MPISINYVDSVLKHYKYRIEQFPLDEEVKTLASAPLTQDLTDLQHTIDAALQERNKIAGQEWAMKYGEILKAAKAQFNSDAEKFLKATEGRLPYAELEKLQLLKTWAVTNPDP